MTVGRHKEDYHTVSDEQLTQNAVDSGTSTDKADVERERCPATTRSGASCVNFSQYPDGCVIHSQTPEAAAARHAGRVKGGHIARQRTTAILGLGVPESEVARITLESGEHQVAILTAVVKSLALGKVSASTANAIGNLVKIASQIMQGDQQEAIKRLAETLERLEQERVIQVGGRR